ncbi:MAG: hypothetical protein ACKOU7_06940 [Ferruginibacter sp.]
MKPILPALLFISITSFSQSADFIQLKKNNKTITSFYSGMDIAFTNESGSFINAHINGIKTILYTCRSLLCVTCQPI